MEIEDRESRSMRFGVFFLSQAPEGATTPAEALRRELRQMQFAEDLGFDSGWLAEHHQSTYCVVPDWLARRSMELFPREVMPALEGSSVYA
jgi:alkanesulfonate monooxygenase SsuD/methylene tetrahydromethanopterin reductase-like flavin-dependent oxidoreductase (luciferase family)